MEVKEGTTVLSLLEGLFVSGIKVWKKRPVVLATYLPFILVVFTTVVVSFGSAYKIAVFLEWNICFVSPTCYNSIFTNFKFPLGAAAAGLSLMGLTGAFFRSEQTERQMQATLQQNVYTNYVTHRKEFFALLEGLEKTYPINFLSKPLVYKQVFPDNNPTNLVLSIDDHTSKKSDSIKITSFDLLKAVAELWEMNSIWPSDIQKSNSRVEQLKSILGSLQRLYSVLGIEFIGFEIKWGVARESNHTSPKLIKPEQTLFALNITQSIVEQITSFGLARSAFNSAALPEFREEIRVVIKNRFKDLSQKGLIEA